MTAIALALGASIAWGVGDFLGGVSSRRLSALTVLAVAEVAGLAAATVALAAFAEDAPGTLAVAAALGAGLGGVVGLGGLYRGMAVGAMGVVAPISAAAAVVPVTVGLVAGDRPGSLQYAGMAFALGGVALVSREPSPAGAKLAAGVGLGLLAALGFGLYFVLIDVASDDGALWAVVISRAAASAAAVAVALRMGVLHVAARTLPTLSVIGLFDVGANALLAIALTHGYVSVVSVLASLYPVVTVLLARVVLDERVARAQLAGAAAALAGAALIAAG